MTNAHDEAVVLVDSYVKGRGSTEVLDRASSLLERACASDPGRALPHAMLGYVHAERGRTAEALRSFERARALDPDDLVVETFVLTLMAESGDEERAMRGIEAAAPRHGIDLAELSGELRAADFPVDARTLLANGFVHARNYLESRLADEAERVRNAREPDGAKGFERRALDECIERQRELVQRLDVTRVPESLRALARWAVLVGVGDDPCRARLLSELTDLERGRLVEDVDRAAAEIHGWLDGFGQEPMPPEAEAFLYLALAAEEARTEDAAE